MHNNSTITYQHYVRRSPLQSYKTVFNTQLNTDARLYCLLWPFMQAVILNNDNDHRARKIYAEHVDYNDEYVCFVQAGTIDWLIGVDMPLKHQSINQLFLLEMVCSVVLDSFQFFLQIFNVLSMTLNCIQIFIVTGCFLYWSVMRPASQRFFMHICIYIRILII